MYKFYYWGPLLYHTEIKDSDVKSIKKLCVKNKKNDHRRNLGGHINEEFTINTDKLTRIIQPYLDQYVPVYKNWYRENIKSIKLKTSWVNFMKKGEYNPPHVHLNCDLSCVIYLDIPKKLQEENNNYIGSIKNGGPGSISFTYGEYNKYAINNLFFSPKKGDFFIFPHNLKHYVFPFKSNVERISVSSNFIIETD